MIGDVLDDSCSACGKRPERLEIRRAAGSTYWRVSCRCKDTWIWVVGPVEARS
jgi:hypothetical protein